MRILWLTTNPKDLYNGEGWVKSLHNVFKNHSDIELALAFPSFEEKEIVKSGNTIYYPLFKKKQTSIQKMIVYYGGYKKIDKNSYVNEIKKVIDDFKPNIIQLFGLECPLAGILGKTDIPVIVHLQGLLGPINNAFYPVGIDKKNILKFGSIKREIILKNGFNFEKRSIAVRSEYEKSLFGKVKYAAGRTHWDKLILGIYSPTSKYYNVSEVLRPVFYDARKWEYLKRDQLIIVSTLSENMYKGLDLVLKTAKILKEEMGLNFEWKIAGVKPNSYLVNILEKTYHINSKDVNIKYLGVQNADEICDFLLNSSLYVHTSYIDNSPNSVCEAQLLGLPVIATNVGGVSSLIEEGLTGELVPANAPYEMAYKIRIFAEKSNNAINIGENARIAALKRHDRNSIFLNLMVAYNDVINDRKH